MTTLFGILGTTAVRLGGDLVDTWGPPRLRAMLGALLIRPGTWVRWERLTELMWTPGTEPRYPSSTLDSYASRLKPVLEQLPGAPRVQTRDRKFRVPADPGTVDYGSFQVMARQARDTTEPSRAAELAHGAVTLWRGPALDDLDTVAAERWRQTAERHELIPAYVTLFKAWLALDEPDQVLTTLEDIHPSHPTNVHLAKIRLSALAALGNRIDTTTYFREIRATLLELGDQDSVDELHEHHDHLIRATRQPSPRRLVPAAYSPCGLPPDHQDFLGRADQLAALDAAAFGQGGSPRRGVLSIDGIPGVGKSTVAIRWAHRVRDRFDDIAYVDMNGFADEDPSDPWSVIDALVLRLDPDGAPGRSAGERHAALRHAGTVRRLLVVLDNVADSQHAHDLLAVLSECLVLVVSRVRLTSLRLRGAKAVTVPPLTNAESAELLRAGLAGRAPEPRPVEQYVASCGGLPLIVTLLADHLATHTGPPPAPDPDDLLFGIGRDGDGHATPERYFSWSYRALPALTRRVFRLAGLHPAGDFSLASAAACAGMDESTTRDALDVLVGAHLLSRAGGRRYRFHDLIRRYARHRADTEDAGERPRAAHRLVEHYLFAAHAAHRALFPTEHARDLDLRPPLTPRPPTFPTSQVASTWFAEERTALVRTIALAADHGHHGHAWRLADYTSPYLARSGHFSDCRRVHELAALSARADNEPEAEASSNHELGLLLHAEGHADKARTHFTAAHDWAVAHGNDRARGVVLKALGDLELDGGSLDTAIDLFSRHLDIARGLNDQEALAWANVALGKALHRAGRTQPAHFHLREAEYYSRMLGDSSVLAEALECMAEIHRDRREWATAEAYLHDALALNPTDIPATARLTIALAALHLDRGAPRSAEPHARRGVAFARNIAAVALLARGLDLLGRIHAMLGDGRQAQLAWTQALHAYSRLGNQVRIAQIRELLDDLRPSDRPLNKPDDDKHSGLL